MIEITEHLPQILDYLFKGLIAFGLYHFRDIKNSMDKLSNSVIKLNTSVAIMFERHDTKDKQIEILMTDVKMLRERFHEINNNFTPRVLVNESRIDVLEKKVN